MMLIFARSALRAVNEPKDDKPTDSGSGHKRKDGKKKKIRRIKEIVYYDDSNESTSS